MVDTPLDRLLEIGYADLHKNQAEFDRVAKEVDPSKTPKEVLAELATIHPAPDQSSAGISRSVQRPDPVHPRKATSSPSPLKSSPPLKRRRHSCALRLLPRWIHPAPSRPTPLLPTSMSPCRKRVSTPAQVADYMSAFNIGTMVSTSVHEAYPGHYVQFLWVPQAPSKVRKLLGSSRMLRVGPTIASR